MNPTLLREMTDHISAAFVMAENRCNVEIPAADKDFLINTMPKIFEAAVDKFVQGAVDHHDSPFLSMSPDDMVKEALKESTDLPFYLYGYFRAKASRRQNVG